jgi:hypothetical protein
VQPSEIAAREVVLLIAFFIDEDSNDPSGTLRVFVRRRYDSRHIQVGSGTPDVR